MQDFQGRVAVVTGAASGIGLASATRFAEEGMKVVLADIQQDALDLAVASLQQAGHDVIGVRTDVSQCEQVQSLADQAMAASIAVLELIQDLRLMPVGSPNITPAPRPLS